MINHNMLLKKKKKKIRKKISLYKNKLNIKSICILQQKENKNIYKKEEKEEKKPKFRIIKKVHHNNVEDEIDEILLKMNKNLLQKKVININYYNLYVNIIQKIKTIQIS